jgi:hypothetical protein
MTRPKNYFLRKESDNRSVPEGVELSGLKRELLHQLLLIVFAVGVLGVILGAGRIALATSLSNSTATIDWTTLSIAGIGISFTSQRSSSATLATDDTAIAQDQDSQAGWGNTSAFSSVFIPPNATANASTTAVTLFEEVMATADGISTEDAFAHADALRTANFLAMGTGVLTVSVDFSLTQALSTDFVGESSVGFAFAHLFLFNMTSSLSDFDAGVLANSVFDGEDLSLVSSGTLVANLFFNAGNTGSLATGVFNDADVFSPQTGVIPEPCTIALLGTGLGLVRLRLMRRRFRRRVA